MRKILIPVILSLFMGLTVSAHSQWAIGFGNKPSEVTFKAPVGPEDFPLGPHAFRVISDRLWVTDSVSGRILIFGAENKLEKSIKVPGFNSGEFIDDFAVQLDSKNEPVSVWISERVSNTLVRFDLSGKELARVPQTANGCGQVDQLACDSSGQLYVGDFSQAKISVFSSSGKAIRKIEWGCTGFAVDGNDNLHVIEYNESDGNIHVVFSSSGKEVSRNILGLKQMQNPRVWSVLKNGELIVSFIPALGNPRLEQLFTFSKTGEILNKYDYIRPYYINRCIAVDNDQAFVVNADYLKGAKGNISLKKLGALK